MFAERLKELRSREKVTQEELAKIIGVERSTVGKYESAKKEVIPSVDVLSRIADFFHVSTDYLLGRTNDPTDYDNGDLIAEIPDHVLEAFDGNVKKALEFQRQAEEDAKAEFALRTKYNLPHGMSMEDIAEAMHKNPRLGVLFSRSAKMDDKAVDAVLQIIDVMNRDGEDGV